ncbi:hypothetical protein OH809_05625 [Streptomyces sp. NBC_00873]|uniref:hypothetical protein n=1 Tax=unclassified Streptomyces TaxID=2593676 RepID=UPI00386BE893|nr:hypothetical protein OH809_05625 [Streptomyces sp. NBC_00873]WTA47706.1 hypothetical protein OH821_38145 [Streptomyces sp. NBC_00842]
MNFPSDSLRSQPRSAGRFSFERIASERAGSVAIPSSRQICLTMTGPSARRTTSVIRW